MLCQNPIVSACWYCIIAGHIASAGEASGDLQGDAILDATVEGTTDEHVAAEQSSMRNRLKPQDQVPS